MLTMPFTPGTATTTTATSFAWNFPGAEADPSEAGEAASTEAVPVAEAADPRQGEASTGKQRPAPIVFLSQQVLARLSFLIIISLSSRVIVTGLPPSGSWQDLKDHMREAGDVCFADVYKDGTGAVEYMKYEDMKYALKKLDDSRFKSHEVSLLLFYSLQTRRSAR